MLTFILGIGFVICFCGAVYNVILACAPPYRRGFDIASLGLALIFAGLATTFWLGL